MAQSDARPDSDFHDFCQRRPTDGIRVDPWSRGTLTPETSAEWGDCHFLLRLSWLLGGAFDGEDSYWLHRPRGGLAQLWLQQTVYGSAESGLTQVGAQIESPELDDRLVGKKLLYVLWASRRGHMGPHHLLEEGTLSRRDWEDVEQQLLWWVCGRVDWRQLDDPHGLLRLADELGLHVACFGHEPTRCESRCPKTPSHSMPIDPDRGLWFCGYCGIHGGARELREAVRG